MSEKIDCDYNRGGDQLIKVLSDFILAYAAHLLVGTNPLKVLANLQQKKDYSIQGNFIVNADSPGLKGLLVTHDIDLQLGSSSRAKHGGAYFSAVFGQKFNPTTVLRPCQPLACYWGVGIAAAPTLFTTSAKHHGSR